MLWQLSGSRTSNVSTAMVHDLSSADSVQGPASREPAFAAHRDAVPEAASWEAARSKHEVRVAPAAVEAAAYDDGAEDDDRLRPWDDPVNIDVRAIPVVVRLPHVS